MCLADYVTGYKDNVVKNKVFYAGKNNNRNVREKRKVLKYCRFKDDNEADFYREQILLFLPWRNEKKEVEEVNHKDVYFSNQAKIESIKSIFNLISRDEMDEIEKSLNEKTNEEMCDISEDEELEDFSLFSKAGKNEPKIDKNHEIIDSKKFKWNKPDPISDDDLKAEMIKLNSKQREVAMHVLNSFKTGDNLPLKIFISGQAGTGKSVLIKVLYQLITRYFNNENRGEINLDDEVVLLTASTGIAAHLIGGNTLHSAFKIMPKIHRISPDITNTIRSKPRRVKLIIVDEASMVGASLLNQLNERLKLLSGKNIDFGGLSVIFVGDLMQLPPVMDRPIFAVDGKKELSRLIRCSPIWKEFKLLELIEVMRQKDDLEFAIALNNLAYGKLTQQNIELLESRVVKRTDVEKQVPINCLRLFSTNKEVDRYNEERIDEVPGILYLSVAEDKIFSKRLTKIESEQQLQNFKKRSKSDTQGVMSEIHLKINIRYMITKNISVSDGLANGTCGVYFI